MELTDTLLDDMSVATTVEDGDQSTEQDALASTEDDVSSAATDLDLSFPDHEIDETGGPPALLELRPPTKSLLEARLRAAAGLRRDIALHPVLRPFRRLEAAIEDMDKLRAAVGYAAGDLGVFAQDLCGGGAKCWHVDTLAGFALANSPRSFSFASGAGLPRPAALHFYEVLLAGRPCWLYFDLEYALGPNPFMDPLAVSGAFYRVLDAFCEESTGARVDPESVYELDCTTQVKFSKHVIIKRLLPLSERGRDGALHNLAFRNNAQAGLFVHKFLAHAREARERDPSSPAGLLFAVAPEAASRARTTEPREACVVDESVYSRNRCFRVLFSSKFGKRQPLTPSWRPLPGEAPAELLLKSLASFVPAGTAPFSHPLIPDDLEHGSSAARPRGLARPSGHARPRGLAATAEGSGLVGHLVAAWDRVRQRCEPVGGAKPTAARQPWLSRDGRFLAFTLVHNRFCFCKGSSHKSNGVYLVVDRAKETFHQKCHDVDCRGFRSVQLSLPAGLLHKSQPEEGFAPRPDADCPPTALDAEEQQPSTPMRGPRTWCTEELDRLRTPSPPRRAAHEGS